MDTGRSVDRYNRLVCVPYLEQRYSDCTFATPRNDHHRAHPFRQSILVTRNIELEMVLNGWAWVLERYCPDDRYFEALEYARSNKRGIWALENNIHPWDFKRQKALKRRRDRRGSRDCPSTRCLKQGCGGQLVSAMESLVTFWGAQTTRDAAILALFLPSEFRELTARALADSRLPRGVQN